MKNTITMLSLLGTFAITWLSLAAIVCLFSSMGYKESATNTGLMLFMFIFGWLPCIAVYCDIENKENKPTKF